MASKRFNSFLSAVAKKLFPENNPEILAPESPPDWTRLGWKAGWIIEEGHTGLQWWVTEDVAWDPMTEQFGHTKLQKKETFARWYADLLDDFAHRLGKPLSLESLRYREMDLSAFEGRPLIEDEDWWVVTISTDASGAINLILSERFVRLFDEDVESSPEPEPPWTFLELWDQIGDRQRRDLLQQIGSRENLLNHLASLVVSGNLDLEILYALMPKRPREDLETIVDDRRSQLDSSSERQRQQTLDQWKETANSYLMDTVGDWLKQDELPTSRWKKFSGQWEDYRRSVLEDSFGSDRWRNLWDNLTDRDLKQVLPRIETDLLRRSLKYLDRGFRNKLLDDLPDSLSERLRESSTGKTGRMEALQARQEVFEEGRSLLESMGYDPEGRWSLEPRNDD
jgi:hypothetical protein